MSKIPNQEYTPEDDDTKDLLEGMNQYNLYLFRKTENSG